VKKWVKLHLFYLGDSKKHIIFRSTQWSRGKDEKIFRKPVFDENYEKIGVIHDIFGPAEKPFISIRGNPGVEITPEKVLYVQV